MNTGPSTADHWVESYITEATALDGAGAAPPGIAEWIERQLAGEPEPLRAEVERRLRAFERFGELTQAIAADNTPHPSTSPLFGLEFGDFRLLERLAIGGMSRVYLAEQVSLGRTVALKLLPSDFDEHDPAGERFLREARIIAKLSHPGIVGVLSYGREHGRRYIALEFVAGETLAECIQRWRKEHPPPGERFRDIAKLAIQIANALAYAHAHGIVHRDIKPSNVIIDSHGAPRIVDFGLAKDRLDRSLSRTGELIGTPQYMAPEQIDSTLGDIDARTDIYGLGATVYECLSLTPPHEGSTLERLAHAITREVELPLRRRARDVPKDLATIVHTALERHPNDRYQGAAEMSADLARFLDGHSILARPIGLGRRLARVARRRPASVLALSLALLLVVSLAAVFVLRHGLERERERADREQRARDGLRLISEVAPTLANDPELALRLAVEGATRAPGLVANNALYQAWRAATAGGRERLLIEAHDAHVHRVRFDAEGERIVSASRDGTIAVWHFDDGALIARCVGHQAAVLDASFSPNATQLISASLDGSARVWRVAATSVGREVQASSVYRAAAPVHFASFGETTRDIIVASLDGTLSCYDGETQRLRWRDTQLPPVSIGRYPDIWSEVDQAVQLTSDRSGVVAGTFDQRLALWDIASGKRRWTSTPLPERICALRVAAHAPRVACYGCESRQAHVFSLVDGREIAVLGREHPHPLRGVAISDDGRRVTASDGYGAKVYDVDTELCIDERLRPQWVAPRQHFAAFRPNSNAFATTHIGGPTLIGLGDRAAVPCPLESDETWVSWLAFHPHLPALVTAGASGRLRIWDLTPRRDAPTLSVPLAHVRGVHYRSDGERVLVVGEVGSSAIEFDRATGAATRTIDEAHLRRALDRTSEQASALDTDVAAAAISAAIYKADGNIEISTGRELLRTSASTTALAPDFGGARVPLELTLRNLDVAPDGESAVLCTRRSVDGRVFVVDSSGAIAELQGHDRAPRTAEFDPSGRRIVTASLDGVARVYALPQTTPILSFRGHHGDVRHARFSPDGQRIVSCSWDRTARVWDVTTASELLVLSGHRQSVEAADFSPDGRTILTASLDGTARLWDAESGEPIAVLSFPAPVYAVEFRADGREFAIGGDADVVHFYPYPPTAIPADSVRELSPVERQRYHLEVDASAIPARHDAPRQVHEIAFDLWRRWRRPQFDAKGSLSATTSPSTNADALDQLAVLKAYTSADYVAKLEALATLDQGNAKHALELACAICDTQRERFGRDDPLAFGIRTLALAKLGDLDAARDALSHAERAVTTMPWNWSRDTDPAGFVDAVAERLDRMARR